MSNRKPRVPEQLEALPIEPGSAGKLFMATRFEGEDKADGGIRRVVEAQNKWLPGLGWELVDDIDSADLAVTHAVGGVVVPQTTALVHHCHGLYWSEYDWKGDWHAAVNAQVIESCLAADAVAAVSEWVAQVLRRGFMRPIYVLPNGVDLDEWPMNGGSHLDYILWNKTRTDAVCDFVPVLELARMVPDREVRTTFRKMGGGIPANINNVGIAPYEDHKVQVRNAGVYLSTTRETFGIGTLEAMASGVPVLGWNWGGNKEIVEHKVTGWLCRPGDYDGLLEGLEYCLANRDRLGKAARAHVSGKYTWERVIGQYAALYAEVLAEKRSRQGYRATYRTGASIGTSTGGTAVEQPRVSVIITNYKLERYLRRAIESCSQLRGCEVIVVDDCSPGDGSGEGAAEIAASTTLGDRVAYCRTPENLYTAGALNYGIERARADIIVCLDADNWFTDASDLIVAALEDNRDIDIAYGSVEFRAVRGVGLAEEETGEHFISDWPPQTFSYTAQMEGKNQIPSTCAFRRHLWEAVGGYRPRWKAVEDADFWCRLTSYGARPKKVTNGVSFVYLDRPSSSSHIQDRSARWVAWYPWNGVNGDPTSAPIGAAWPKEQLRNLAVPTHEPVLVSVIIPVGPGHEKYLVDAIDSVLAQTFTKWELIVVDDTGSLLPTYWVPAFARLTSTLSGGSGPAAARNMGLEVAEGRVFVCLDADDFLEPTALESMWKVWSRPVEQGGGGFVYGDFTRVGGPEHGTVYKCPEWEQLQAEVLLKSPIPVTFMGPMDAEIRFDESLPAWEDWDFLMQLMDHEQGYCGTHIPVSVLNYRLETGMRREQNYERRHDNIQAFHAKWGEYREGRTTLMACSGCGGGGGRQAPAFSTGGIGSASARGPMPMGAGVGPDGAPVPSTVDQNVLVDYLQVIGGQRTYNGPITGTAYRFGDDAGHKTRWVEKRDAAAFVGNRPDLFQYHDEQPAQVTGANSPGPVAPPTPELVTR